MKDFPALLGKRIIIVAGHYGSGKTEFSVNLAMHFATQLNTQLSPQLDTQLAEQLSEQLDVRPQNYKRVALVDLDIINPYFRSRERRKLLEKAGVSVYGSLYKTDITAEIPALGAEIRVPLEDKDCLTIIDLGGNDSGALVLNQFKKYLLPEHTVVLAVINANRPETRDVLGAIEHLASIEAATGLTITHIVNNTNLLRETSVNTIIKGRRLVLEVCEKTDREFLFDCYPVPVLNADDLRLLESVAFPLELYMRETWLDRG
jgi:hypothetical protein